MASATGLDPLAVGPVAPPAGSAAQVPQWPPGRPGRIRFAQLPYLIVLVGAALALLTMRLGARQARDGTFVLAGVLLAAALARLTLPEHRAGLLASRRRLFDVAVFAALGIGLLVGGLVLRVPS
jgi:hypothetical protein